MIEGTIVSGAAGHATSIMGQRVNQDKLGAPTPANPSLKHVIESLDHLNRMAGQAENQACGLAYKLSGPMKVEHSPEADFEEVDEPQIFAMMLTRITSINRKLETISNALAQCNEQL